MPPHCHCLDSHSLLHLLAAAAAAAAGAVAGGGAPGSQGGGQPERGQRESTGSGNDTELQPHSSVQSFLGLAADSLPHHQQPATQRSLLEEARAVIAASRGTSVGIRSSATEGGSNEFGAPHEGSPMQAGDPGTTGAGPEPASTSAGADDLAAATANYLEQARAILHEGGGVAGSGRLSSEGVNQSGAASSSGGVGSSRNGDLEDASSSARSSRDRQPSLRRLATANYLEQARAVVGSSAEHAEGSSNCSDIPPHPKPAFHLRRESAYSSNELLDQARAAMHANTVNGSNELLEQARAAMLDDTPPTFHSAAPPSPGPAAPPQPSSLPSTSAAVPQQADLGNAHGSSSSGSRLWATSGSRSPPLVLSGPADGGSGGVGGGESFHGCDGEANEREVAPPSRLCKPRDSAFGGLAGEADPPSPAEMDSARLPSAMMAEEGGPSAASHDLYELD
mmetsp:Transcript_10889/g.29874  ORF Transcript_10889/g.29874 Transcript_10889/m.29874 type:complete len:451 (+) Transcript_10889:366-1718(+)